MTIDPYYTIIIIILTFIQNFTGVGILVLGTPIFLILNFEFIHILSILLPISISVSFFSYFLMKKKYSLSKLNITNRIKREFFLITIPSIFVGILILKLFNELINFKILVALIITCSLLFKNFKNRFISKMNNFYSKLIMFLIGIVHGVTNSGGTLLLLFIPILNKKSILENRYNTTYFYFFLATFQYCIFIFFLKSFFNLKLILFYIFIALFFSFIANNVYDKINIKLIKYLIPFTALSCTIFLIIDSI